MPVAGHPGCSECRLKCAESTWVVPHDFNYNAKYLVVLDQYKPSAVKQATKLLESCDFDTAKTEFAFTTRCWDTEDNKGQVREGQKCLPLLSAVLDKVSKDTIIVPAGATPCKLVAGAKSIQTAHGTVTHDERGRVVIPTLSPGQTVAYPESLSTFIADLQVIKNAGQGEFTTAVSTHYTLVDSIPKFQQMVAELWLSDKYATDIESSTLDAFRWNQVNTHTGAALHPVVLGMSFSNKAREAWFLPIDHKDHVWNAKERAHIVKILKKLLESKHNYKILHNGKFDTKYLRKILDIQVARFEFDTLLAHYTAVSEVAGTHGLKILAWEFTDMGGYDDAMDTYKLEHPEADPDQGGSYAEMPLSLLWKYGAADADCTFRLFEIFLPKIQERFRDLFCNIIMPACQTLANIEYEGVPVDLEYLAYCREEFPKLLGVELDRLREFPEVLAVEKSLNDRALAKKRAERVKRFQVRSQAILDMKATNPDKAVKALARLRGDIERAKQRPCVVKPITFNPKSPDQVTELFYDVMGYTHTKRTKEGNRCADKEVMKDWWFEYKHPIIMAVGKYVKLMTMYSMFVKETPDRLGDDGRLRGSYNLAGTETGRLSMSDPNLQQIPRNLEEDALEPFIDPTWPSIKRLFAANDPAFCIMQFDYSQAELRWLAALSRDPILLDAYAKGQDVHQRVAAEVYSIILGREITLEAVTKPQRYVAKRVNFGLLYGQGARKLAAFIGCTVDEAKAFIKQYFKKLKGVQRWIEKTKKTVVATGESWSPYGRLRRLMAAFSPNDDIVARAERQGVNSPIQSAASDCTLMSLIAIDTWLRENNMLSRIVVTVHDSIILRVALKEVGRVYQAVKRIMQSPPHDGVLDDMIMEADGDMGKNWGQMKGIKKVEDIKKVYEELWKGRKAA